MTRAAQLLTLQRLHEQQSPVPASSRELCLKLSVPEEHHCDRIINSFENPIESTGRGGAGSTQEL